MAIEAGGTQRHGDTEGIAPRAQSLRSEVPTGIQALASVDTSDGIRPDIVSPPDVTHIDIPAPGSTIPKEYDPSPKHRGTSGGQRAGAAANIFIAVGSFLSPVDRPVDLGPIRDEDSSYVSEYSPDRFDLSTQGAPLVQNGVVETSYGDLPVVNLEVQVDPALFPVAPGEIVRISTVEEEARDYNEDGVEDASPWLSGDQMILTDQDTTYPPVDLPMPMGTPQGDSFVDFTEYINNKPGGLSVSGANDGVVVIERFDEVTHELTGSEVQQVQIQPTTVCEDGTEIVMGVDAPAYADSVCDIADLYAPFLTNPARVVVNQTEARYDRNSHFDPSDNVLRVSLPVEAQIGTYRTDEEVRIHEFSHIVYEELGEDVKERLESAFQIMKNNMRYRMPTFEETNDYDVAKNEPVWAVITESTYYRRLGRDENAGHPHDLPTENFASTINTIRTFPDLMLEEYPTLLPNERMAASITVVETVSALRSVNDDPEALLALMPQLPTVLQELAADSANVPIQPQIKELLEAIG
jgi:hypothetical protein